jgi:hypothetical protein
MQVMMSMPLLMIMVFQISLMIGLPVVAVLLLRRPWALPLWPEVVEADPARSPA